MTHARLLAVVVLSMMLVTSVTHGLDPAMGAEAIAATVSDDDGNENKKPRAAEPSDTRSMKDAIREALSAKEDE